MKSFRKYYICSLLGTMLLAFYPIYMGVRVLADWLPDGYVLASSYPKYLIPYTPISIAVLLGLLILPMLLNRMKRFSLPTLLVIAIAVFFASELFFEKMVVFEPALAPIPGTELIVKDEIPTTTVENWQMYLCAAPSTTIVEPSELEVLQGDYNPAFKLHFYLISVVLIVGMLSTFHGLGQMILTGDRRRQNLLMILAIATLFFLGLCIFACFTAFFRTGTYRVSPLSATLMSVFFILLGFLIGIFMGSLLHGRKRWLSIGVPSISASLVTLLMYIGEMILLHGRVYRFGSGLFFDGIGVLVLAPVDILVILAAGGLTAALLRKRVLLDR